MTKQEIQSNIDQIRNTIAEGKTGEALNSLADLTKTIGNDKFRDRAIHFQATLSKIEKKSREELVDSSNLTGQKNKLNLELLTMLTLMENQLVEGMSPEESRVNTDIPPISPPTMNPPSTSKINWAVIIPIVLVVLAGLVYLFFFMNDKEEPNQDVCEEEFENATSLFDDKKYSEARQLFTDIKFHCPVDDEAEIERYIRLCNEGMASDGISEGVTISEIEMTAQPQVYTGKCPIEIQFEALILTNQTEGELTCQLKLSNGKSVNDIKAEIQPSGAADVKLALEFGEDDIPEGELIMTLEVLEPVEFASADYKMTIKCIEEPTEKPEQAIVDGRDGRRYRYKKIGNTTWLLDNMNLELDKSTCLDCKEHGRHYKKEVVPKDVCPKGYGLPTIKEFEAAKRTLGSFDKLVQALEIKPAGKYFGSNSSYNSTKNISAYFWVADVEKRRTGDLRKNYFMDFENKTSKGQTQNQYNQYSCRCVKRFFIPDLKFKYVIPKIANPNLRIQPGN